MGTCIPGAAYNVIAFLLLGMGKMSRFNMISMQFASFLSFSQLSSVIVTDSMAFLNYIFTRKFHFIFENPSGI